MFFFSFCLLGGVWVWTLVSLMVERELAFTDTIYDVNKFFHFKPKAQPDRPPTSSGGYPQV